MNDDGGTDLTIVRSGRDTTISWRRPRSFAHWAGLAFACCWWAFATAFWVWRDTFAPGSQGRTMFGVTALFVGIISALFSYRFLALLLDRTTVTLSQGHFTLRRAPLPWGWHPKLALSEIAKVTCVQQHDMREDNLWTTSHYLALHLVSGRVLRVERWSKARPGQAIAGVLQSELARLRTGA